MELPLTKEQIERDIEAYQDRLRVTQEKLNDLPKKGSTWKERSKIKAARRTLLSEIQHIKTVIGYAQEALAEVVG